MDGQLTLQDGVAQALAKVRHEHGALDFETIELQPTFDGDTVTGLQHEQPNRAKALIENLMIAANGATARFLEARGFPSIRRVVKAPERWDRIVALAKLTGDQLPPAPDSLALAAFLVKRKAADPNRFPDLSLSVIRLLGPGEYCVEAPGSDPPGHFGLAVKDYTHSTAPNRRFPDLITHRLMKAALAGAKTPYTSDELTALATHCTEAEDAANKVERQVRKSAAACILEDRIGQRFDGIVTGASEKGTWLDVGDRVAVRLTRADVEKGFIDFERA